MKHYRYGVRLLILAAALPLCVGCPVVQSPVLRVTPTVISYGSQATLETLTITNIGGGSLSWEVVESLPWLEVDTASGVAAASSSDKVDVQVSRVGLSPGTVQGTFTIRTTDGLQTQTIGVAMTVGGTPTLSVSPSPLAINVDSGSATTTETLTLVNNGSSLVNWTITPQDPADPGATFPYLSFDPSPAEGTLASGGTADVDVILDNAQLPSDTFSIQLVVSSPEIATDQIIAMNVEVGGTGEGAAIGVSMDELDFGTLLSKLVFDVYNAGEEGTLLSFSVTAAPSGLLTVSPGSGTSTSMGDPQQVEVDGVPITVELDRSLLTDELTSGTITVSAAGVDSVVIPVSFEKGDLTFEGAKNRTRAPFIQRFVFTLRDSLGETIDTRDPVVFQELQTAFRVEEDEVPLDTDETSLIINGPERLNHSVALLLDYTGSMHSVMQELDPDSPDPLQELYGGNIDSATDEGLIGAFLRSLPDPVDDGGLPKESYSVAIMEYHERQQSNRLIHNFSLDRDSLITELRNFSIPESDHGSSEIFDAIVDACERLEAEDVAQLPFYDADVRSLIFISDGRDTSSVSTLQDAIDAAVERKVRLYPVGFGSRLNSEPLIQMATESGGHYYAAADLTDLTDLFERRIDVAGSTEGLIVEDMKRQIMLTYVTLFQDDSHTYCIYGSYNGDEGSFERDAEFAVDGDVRAGQIALMTRGIDEDAGTARVFVRADYIPRNISQLRMRAWTTPNEVGDPDPDFTVSLIDGDDNGLIENWTLVEQDFTPPAPANEIAGSRVFSVLTTEDNPLKYGSFGELLEFSFTNVPGAGFTFHFRVDNRIYVDPPVTKFFQHPEELEVSAAPRGLYVVPILITDGFDPDEEYAWDRDEDSAADFDDRYPDDEANS